MKDLNLLLENAKHIFDTLDIEYGNVTKIEVNYRAKNRWGQCRMKNGNYTININCKDLEGRSIVGKYNGEIKVVK